MNVDDLVNERIAAARRRIEQRRTERARRQRARTAGLAQRHAAKLRRLGDPNNPNAAPVGDALEGTTDEQG